MSDAFVCVVSRRYLKRTPRGSECQKSARDARSRSASVYALVSLWRVNQGGGLLCLRTSPKLRK